MYDVPLATTRRECLWRQKGRLIQKNGVPLATPRRECLCIGDPSVRVSLEAKRAAHSEKRRPIGDSPVGVPLGKFFLGSNWRPLGESASQGRQGGSFRKTASHWRQCLWEFFIGSMYYVRRPIGNPFSRVPLKAGRAVHSEKRRSIGDSLARVPLGKFICAAKGSIPMAIRKIIPRSTNKPPGLYRGG